MEVVYKLKPEELNDAFLDNLKRLFSNEEIVISVISAKSQKNLTPSYSEKLLNAVKSIDLGDYKEFTGDELAKLANKLMEE